MHEINNKKDLLRVVETVFQLASRTSYENLEARRRGNATRGDHSQRYRAVTPFRGHAGAVLFRVFLSTVKSWPRILFRRVIKTCCSTAPAPLTSAVFRRPLNAGSDIREILSREDARPKRRNRCRRDEGRRSTINPGVSRVPRHYDFLRVDEKAASYAGKINRRNKTRLPISFRSIGNCSV